MVILISLWNQVDEETFISDDRFVSLKKAKESLWTLKVCKEISLYQIYFANKYTHDFFINLRTNLKMSVLDKVCVGPRRRSIRMPGETNRQWCWQWSSRPHICYRYHRLYPWRKICHVEKFQISVKNLNNLWSFIEIYAVFVLNLCGEKSVWAKSVWRKNDKYEVCATSVGSVSSFI